MTAKRPLLFRNRNFALLWLGQILSQSGTRMYQIAILWWLITTAQENSGQRVGLFMVCAALPALIFVKKIGHFVDRGNFRRILMGCDALGSLMTLSLLVYLSLTLPGSIAIIYVAGFVLSLLQAITDPTLYKSVPELVEPVDAEPAVALISSTQSFASFAGAICGAFFIEKVGMLGVIFINGLSYLLCLVTSYLIQVKARESEAGSSDSSQAMDSAWHRLKSRPLLKRVLLGFGVVNFFLSPITIVMPIYVNRVLSGTASLLAWLESALCLGLIAGTFAAPLVKSDGKVLLVGGSCIFICGLGVLLPGFIVMIPIYAAALALVGVSLGINNVKFVSLFQRVVPDSEKGSFFALLGALVSITAPLSYFIFGFMADHLNVVHLCIIQGCGVVLISLWYLKSAAREPELFSNPVPL